MEHIILAIAADTHEKPSISDDTIITGSIIIPMVIFVLILILLVKTKNWDDLAMFIAKSIFWGGTYYLFLYAIIVSSPTNEQNNLDKRDTSTNNNIDTESINIPWSIIGQIALLILLSIILLTIIVLTLSYVVKKIKQYNEAKKQQLSILQHNNKEWNNLQDRYDKIMFLYADAESSPETVIYRPVILSTTYSLTRDFHNNKEIACNILESRIDLDKCREAVKTLENTWYNLYETAENVGLPGINKADKRRAANLLRMVQDESYGVPERSNALSKLKNILDKIEFSLKEKTNIFDKLMFNIELSTNVRLELI